MILTKDIITAYEKFTKSSDVPFCIKGIFFDMDGVLFDSMPNHAKAWKQAFHDFDLEIPLEEAYLNEGSPAYMTAINLFRKFKNIELTDEEATAVKKRKHAIMDGLSKSTVMPFMPDLVEKISQAGIDCWVVTGSAQNLLLDRINKEYRGFLSRHKMITAHDVKIGKPTPEPYLKAMERSGLTPNEVIVVENAPLGILSSKAAGLFTIAINTGPLNPKVLSEAGADLVLSGSEELFNTWPQLEEVFCNKTCVR